MKSDDVNPNDWTAENRSASESVLRNHPCNQRQFGEAFKRRLDSHGYPYKGMPPSAPSSATPDLFSYVPSTPVPGARRTPAQVKSAVAELSNLSDARLTRLLRGLTDELQRRKAGGTAREDQPVLDRPFMTQPVRWRALSHGRQDAHNARRRQMLHPLSRGPSATIRAALQAGVAFSPVARHFGLPRAVRKLLTGAK